MVQGIYWMSYNHGDTIVRIWLEHSFENKGGNVRPWDWGNDREKSGHGKGKTAGKKFLYSGKFPSAGEKTFSRVWIL
jgi:hypothetical protein